MKKFEYGTISYRGNVGEFLTSTGTQLISYPQTDIALIEILNNLGLEGWRVVANQKMAYLLMREIL